MLLSTSLALGLPKPAQSFVTPPPGFKLHQDRLDGYYFFYPETWIPVTTSGNDIFYRNPANVNENLFVSISSPSSSKYVSVEMLGPPEAVAKQTRAQYLDELLSTRLGVKRKADIVSAAQRIGPNGKTYYDIEMRIQSLASRNQLAVSQQEVNAGLEVEWDRHYVTVIGAANRRLYEFRLQTATKTYDTAQESLLNIAHSFGCKDIEA